MIQAVIEKKNEYCIYGQLKLIAKLTGRVCIIKLYTALFVIFSVFWRQTFLFLTLFQIQKSSFSFYPKMQKSYQFFLYTSNSQNLK